MRHALGRCSCFLGIRVECLFANTQEKAVGIQESFSFISFCLSLAQTVRCLTETRGLHSLAAKEWLLHSSPSMSGSCSISFPAFRRKGEKRKQKMQRITWRWKVFKWDLLPLTHSRCSVSVKILSPVWTCSSFGRGHVLPAWGPTEKIYRTHFWKEGCGGESWVW